MNLFAVGLGDVALLASPHECRAASAVAPARDFDQRGAMFIDRRELLAVTALLAASVKSTRAQSRRLRFHAVAFDGLTVFDARRTLVLAEAAFPSCGSPSSIQR